MPFLGNCTLAMGCLSTSRDGGENVILGDVMFIVWSGFCPGTGDGLCAKLVEVGSSWKGGLWLWNPCTDGGTAPWKKGMSD